MVERASPFAEPPVVTGAAVQVAPLTGSALWQIAAWPDTVAAVETALSQACGVDAPPPGRIATVGDGGRLIRVEPLKWWLMDADGAPCRLTPGADTAVIADLGHDQAGIEITGPKARDLLARLVSLDLRPARFPDGTFATTEMHHMITRVLRDDRGGEAARFEIMVMRSYADVLREVALDHARALG